MRRSLFALAALGLAAALLAVAPAGAEPSTDGPVPPAGEESSPDPSPAPPGEEDALVGAVSVATGYYHSCARLANNEVRCWGYNEYGQLGDGFPGIDSYTAVVTKNANGDGPLQNVTQVVAGDLFTCALLTTRQVHCWGYNEYGQLGDGTFDDSSLPVVVQNVAGDGPLQNVRQIGAEGGGMCAVLTNDELRCWGEDDLGQLGNGAPLTNSNLPVIVKGLGGNGRLTGVASVGGGYGNNCAVLRNGQARCWGYNGGGLTYSVLGNGNSTDTPHPVVVKNLAGTGPLTGVTQISNGGYHGCARLSNGQARCWGENYEGALGTGNLTERLLPVAVRRVGGGALTGVVRILAGVDSTCALVTGGQVRCWGLDEYGLNGDGTFESPLYRTLPTPVRNGNNTANLQNVTRLDLQSHHACVPLSNGRVRCWGYNSNGALGNGGTDDEPLPVAVLTLPPPP